MRSSFLTAVWAVEADRSISSHSDFIVRHISSWMSTEAPKSSSLGKEEEAMSLLVEAAAVDAAEGVTG